MAQPVSMSPQTLSAPARWTSYIMSAIPVALMIFSAIGMFRGSQSLIQLMTQHLAWSEQLLPWIAVLQLGAAIIYLIPRTAVLGAVLVTGYFGGAIATHLRVGDAPIFQAVLIVLAWGGLYLRELRLRALLPLRR
ncbi:MAG TPA: DoxX family protein [Gemmatimonadales bacterium]|nr:DoxX family protein [Gemmatimonadales bacterium]